jgi:hypothetical protein
VVEFIRHSHSVIQDITLGMISSLTIRDEQILERGVRDTAQAPYVHEPRLLQNIVLTTLLPHRTLYTGEIGNFERREVGQSPKGRAMAGQLHSYHSLAAF